jgi:hypothetical protein
MGYITALCTCNCLACGCCYYASSHLRGVSHIRFDRGIHSLYCANVYVDIKLKGHELQSVGSAVMMLRNLRVFYQKLEPLHSTKGCAFMVLNQKTTVEVMSCKGVTSFKLPYVESKVGCTYMCIYVFMYYLYLY